MYVNIVKFKNLIQNFKKNYFLYYLRFFYEKFLFSFGAKNKTKKTDF